jgi:hypothetical protein
MDSFASSARARSAPGYGLFHASALLRPESLDDYVGPENPVRFIEALSIGWI